jgi:hypothetical protein
LHEFQQKIGQQAGRDAIFKKELLAAAPRELRRWVEDVNVLDTLFTYGQYIPKLEFNGEYGFTNYAAVKKQMTALSTTWKGIVHIRVHTPEVHRVKVKFTAVL